MRAARWLVVAAVGLAGLFLVFRPAPACEGAMAKKDYAAAATACEQAYLKKKKPAHALATIRALGLSNREADVIARLPWLEGTPYAVAGQYYAALAARKKSDDAGATAALTKCVAEAPAAGLHDYAARCARQLASLQWIRGDFEAAFKTLTTALVEVRQSEDPVLEGKVYGQLGDLLAEVGDEAGEARALAEVANRFRGSFPGGFAQARLRQGLLELKRGNEEIARDCFEEALAIGADAGLKPVVRSAHVSLAAVGRALDDFDAGQRQLDLAAAVPAERSYEHTTLSFAQAQLFAAQQRWPEVQQTVSAALDAGALADWQWQLHAVAGEGFEQQGLSGQAQASYAEATRVIEGLRQSLGSAALRPGLLAERRKPYEALFALHVREGRAAAAVDVMEQLLTASFLETMAQAQPTPGDLETSAREALRRVDTLKRVAASDVAKPPAGDVLAQLGSREVLAFLAAQGTLYRVHVVNGKAEARALGPLADILGGTDADALGARLWPTEPTGTELLIVTDTALGSLSFAGLRVNGRYLVEEKVLSSAPGLGVAAVLSKARPAGKGAVVLGDPRNNLPGAAAEARATAIKLGTTAVTGDAATIASWKEGCGAQLLHVAAHSGVGADGPWLELADGVVTASMVLAERCRPDVVFLASCASAASSRKDGTLGAAFLAAGSRQVIATTRSIDDATAATFARALFEGGSLGDQVPQRVAAAQRELLKSGAPPSAWAPFIVLGP